MIIQEQDIELSEPKYIDMELPEDISGEFKTYTDYRKITNKKSKQWKLQESAIIDGEGFRKYNGLYMVALGSYYSSKVGIE